MLLTTAVVLVGLLGLLNLLLVLAVIRRLGEQTKQVNRLLSGPGLEQLLPVGAPLPAFTGESVDGRLITSAESPPQLLALLSTTCEACAAQLPDLRRFVEAETRSPAAAVVVIAGPDNAESQRLVDELRSVATVIREPFDGPIGKVFPAGIYPTFYLVADGTVRAGDISVAKLPRPVPA
ncbi:TlpA family protein disulfide reductase [Rhizomonospora bruguierae]|uniref:TlpA family protein disulfide reductase n=1 Tax=Rhizomonospora bruguierae TaxID=1581705 RepID=UPI001BCF240E|nr:hypothetical protein [Micromonospora sp. NBRC 107566]